MRSTMHSARICLSAALMSVMLTTVACTTQSQRIGADDGSDVCRPQRVALDSTGDFFAEDIIKGAAIGAVGGGLAGLIAGGNARSALIGAAAGAAVGGAAGYWNARMQQQRDQSQLYMTVYSDIQRDNAQMDKTQIAFTQLVDCRQQTANRIKADYRLGRIVRPQAEAAMADVRRRSMEDLQIARNISQKIQGRSSNFEFASQQVGRGSSQAAPQGTSTYQAPRPRVNAANASAGSAASVQQATSTNLAKRDQFNRSINQAQARQTQFELG